MEDEILEIHMFKLPPDWGYRVIKRGDEIILQKTNDKGISWEDMPHPDVKLILPDTQMRSSQGNPYAGLSLHRKNTETLRSSTEREFKNEVLEAIESGKLLSYVVSDDGLEHITFLGVHDFVGLQSGLVYRDSNYFLKITP